MDEIINQTSPIIEPIPVVIPKKKLPIRLWTILIIFIFLLYIITKQQLLTTSKQEISETIIPTTKPTQILTITPETTNEIKSIDKELYPYINPQNNPNLKFEIINNENDYYMVSSGDGISAGNQIWKKENGKFRLLMSGEGLWNCEIMIQENIPALLTNYECYDEKTYESKRYNLELKTWEKIN